MQERTQFLTAWALGNGLTSTGIKGANSTGSST